MARLVRRAVGGLGLLLSATALAACSTTLTPPDSIPAHPTAVGACMDSLGEGWQVAVEADRPTSSVVALVKGDSLATCQTWPNAERTDFGNTVTGVGMHPHPSPAVLSFLTSSRSGKLAPFFVGRLPSSATTVRLTFLDGSETEAILGGGLWLAWPGEADVGAPMLIEAIDASGQAISRLADEKGLQPTD